MTLLSVLLQDVHLALTKSQIDHALIGGIALATLGVNRATADIDFLIDESDRQKVIDCLQKEKFHLRSDTDEVLHFSGSGYIDILLARRSLSKKMLKNAKEFSKFNVKCVSPEGIIGLKIQAYKNNPKREHQDKADIQSLIEIKNNLNWEEIKQYADLFGAWDEILDIKKKLEK